VRVAAIAASLLTLVGLLAAVPASGGAHPTAVKFRVSGSVSGLFPGARRYMSVKVRNPYKRVLRLVSLSAEVRRARRLCTGSNVDVRSFRGRLSIAPRRTRVVRLLVEMQPTVVEECKGARFPLRFRAKGIVR
jgi:hypothetical protein